MLWSSNASRRASDDSSSIEANNPRIPFGFWSASAFSLSANATTVLSLTDPVYYWMMIDDALTPDSSTQNSDELVLLTPLTRTLLAIAEHPNATLTELSSYVVAGPQRVSRAVSSLAKAGLIVRTKVGRRNQYQVNVEAVTQATDIKRLLKILT